MTGVRYLFTTSGEYAGFIIGNSIFTPDAEWIAFVVNGNEVYSTDGQFIGYLLDDDRIARRRNETKPRMRPPLRPMRPLRPLRPLRRLCMPRLPSPYEDVFEAGLFVTTPGRFQAAPNLKYLEGALILAADGTPLGRISRDRYTHDSIANPYGEFGSPYSRTSIFNEYGQYGGPYGQYSPFNPYAAQPPRVFRGNSLLGYLSLNPYVSGERIDPEQLRAWLNAA